MLARMFLSFQRLGSRSCISGGAVHGTLAKLLPIREQHPSTSQLARKYRDRCRVANAPSRFRAKFLILGLFGGATILYVANLKTIPGSGRWSFNWISPDQEIRFSRDNLAARLERFNGKMLPNTSSEVMMVWKILNALIPHTGVQDQGSPWEVRVIDDPFPTAFVSPGSVSTMFSSTH